MKKKINKNHQALAVKEKHYETKWWECSGEEIPSLNSATARKNWRAKPCQILWSRMGWARGNTKNLFIYYIPHIVSCHKFLNHSEEKKKSQFLFFPPHSISKFKSMARKKPFILSCSQPLELFPNYSGAFTSRAKQPLCKWTLSPGQNCFTH